MARRWTWVVLTLLATVALLVGVGVALPSNADARGLAANPHLPALSVTLWATPTTGTVPLAVNFQANVTGGSGAYLFEWTWGDGNTSTSVSSTYTWTYSYASTFSADVIVLDLGNFNAALSNSVSITVNPGVPLGIFGTATPASGAAPLLVYFNSTANGGSSPYTFEWDFGFSGAGNVSYSENTTYTYTTAGSYTAILNVTDATGTYLQQSFSIIVTGGGTGSTPLAVTASASPTSGLTPLTVNFASTVTGGTPSYAYAWNYGDGSALGTTSNPSHVYTVAGNYTVNLTVTDTASHVAYANIPVTVAAPPPPLVITGSFTPTPSVGTLPFKISYTGSASGGKAPYNYTWYFGDGSDSYSQSGTHTYSTAGNFTAYFLVFDTTGATKDLEFNVTVNPAVTAKILPSVSAGGAPLDVTFSSSASGGTAPYSVSWTFGDGQVGSGATASHTYSTKGNYNATVWINDSSGSHAHATAEITVAPALTASVTLSNNDTAKGTPVTLTAKTAGGLGAPSTYAWTLNGTTISESSDTFSYVPAGSGSYTFEVTATDNDGQTATAKVILAVLSPTQLAGPKLSAFTVAPSSVATGATATFTATASGGYGTLSYTYTGLPTSCTSKSSPTLSCTPEVTGVYTVQLEVKDSAGKTAFGNATLTVTSTNAAGSASPWGLYVIGIIILLVVVALAVLWTRIYALRHRGDDHDPTPEELEAMAAVGALPVAEEVAPSGAGEPAPEALPPPEEVPMDDQPPVDPGAPYDAPPMDPGPVDQGITRTNGQDVIDLGSPPP